MQQNSKVLRYTYKYTYCIHITVHNYMYRTLCTLFRGILTESYMYRTMFTEPYVQNYTYRTVCTWICTELCTNVVVQNLDVILTEVSEGMPCTEGPEETAPLGSYTCRSTSKGLFTYFKTWLSGHFASIFYFNI